MKNNLIMFLFYAISACAMEEPTQVAITHEKLPLIKASITFTVTNQTDYDLNYFLNNKSSCSQFDLWHMKLNKTISKGTDLVFSVEPSQHFSLFLQCKEQLIKSTDTRYTNKEKSFITMRGRKDRIKLLRVISDKAQEEEGVIGWTTEELGRHDYSIYSKLDSVQVIIGEDRIKTAALFG